jgi:hypothetical protein
MIKRALSIVAINILVLFVLMLVVEGACQMIALIYPSYEVLFLQPDRVVGWKHVPNLRWTWAGHYWYAADFNVDIQTNPLGFRDLTREIAKPKGAKRVALLGDSFIEAVQVRFEKTAGQILERKLNFSSPVAGNSVSKWEVLNFGISNYGIGQYLLVWEEYAKQFQPDYVAIFVAKFHMQRTVDKYEYGAFSRTQSKNLNVRPIFRLENDSLVREPAKDFDDFVRIQTELIDSEFAGHRSRRRKQWILPFYMNSARDRFDDWRLRHFGEPKLVPRRDADVAPAVLSVNSRIIEELGRDVASGGSRLVVIDVSQYFGDDEHVSRALKELCTRNHLGYIPVYELLMKANADGLRTNWKHDLHFNELGNEILANALYDWIATQEEHVSALQQQTREHLGAAAPP